jgi:hypothetical protein
VPRGGFVAAMGDFAHGVAMWRAPFVWKDYTKSNTKNRRDARLPAGQSSWPGRKNLDHDWFWRWTCEGDAVSELLADLFGSLACDPAYDDDGRGGERGFHRQVRDVY